MTLFHLEMLVLAALHCAFWAWLLSRKPETPIDAANRRRKR